MYKVIDLFAGAGGLSLGFKQTGAFDIVVAAENNENAQKTYRKNHAGTTVLGDIRQIDFEDLRRNYGDIDVVIGGPPCQGFSNANRQKAQTISLNNGLVKEYVRAIRELQPKVFVMENVGMLRSEIHRFYYSKKDVSVVDSLGIVLRPDELLLLPDEQFSAEDREYLLTTLPDYQRYLWETIEYLVVNVLYRQRRNFVKLKKASQKYSKRIYEFIARYSSIECPNTVVKAANTLLANALSKYMSSELSEEELICAIEPAVLLQRMYMHYGELVENEIELRGISAEKGICAKVSSFPVFEYVQKVLCAKPYCYNITSGVLNAADFGVPQKRERFIIIGAKESEDVDLPVGTFTESTYRRVIDAIGDLETVKTYFNVTTGARQLEPIDMEPGSLVASLRDSTQLHNHVITETQPTALERFASLQQGDNFHDLDDKLKSTYTDEKRTQNTIYLRLKYDEPSGTVVNVRKSMWIHPTIDRALSIREAARLQSFPDSFVFVGTKDSQYQQVGNAVPPMLAKAIAEKVLRLLENAHA